ncbi:GDP-mannose-dependent alpha-(1-6)-phosphatidylinositol monomannoside mannosyltransferase [Modestobacter caceresii]|uniref:GDP-mannose-dependent alpha-(1-6)-phosphatidylinositol monomannoside mannosyltransferase n=1 Tax=Modestobacter caceresii TaxID=1522368 RepID=A0A098YA67_9ACTN|nr:glycosyltransferase family 4 protein [Modestobacter caceresii]KGH47327.1 GDP-mannose-dependent alpha-(1-6)-phosphatidylinositol monomannoside mannosyltransferase [Modestobacter caceresii]
MSGDRTLVVTNDFPPRQGGIQTFVAALLATRPPDSLVVLASDHPGSAAYDAALPYPVVRAPTGMLLPTPRVARTAARLVREHGCRTAFFGAAAPLGLLAPALRRAGVERLVGATHGHETGWVALPAARQLLQRIAGGLDVVTYISEYTHGRLAPALGVRTDLAQLSPGVDVDRFTPDADGAPVRERYGLGDDPVVVCVSRLVPRKGQDLLVEGWAQVLARHPRAKLLLVGGGPLEQALRRAVSDRGLTGSVVLTGGVPPADLPAYYAAGDVFAMPCRTRRGGLDVEGLGMVFLEAAACGRPVVAGTSGGAPETVREGVTGHVVDPRSPAAVAGVLADLLDDPAHARAMGEAGRAWVEQRWSWTTIASTFADLLDPAR